MMRLTRGPYGRCRYSTGRCVGPSNVWQIGQLRGLPPIMVGPFCAAHLWPEQNGPVPVFGRN